MVVGKTRTKEDNNITHLLKAETYFNTEVLVYIYIVFAYNGTYFSVEVVSFEAIKIIYRYSGVL